MTAPARLVAHHVAKRFGGRTVLENVSLHASEHELVAVLGPSGAGKTTLFRCLTGLLAPDSGCITVDGLDIRSLKGRSRRRVAVVFQQFNLVSRLTALENVLAGRLGHVAAWRGWLRCFDPADHRLALDCLDRVGLSAQAGQRADTLSGGQQQRVAIARALAQQPRLIVADEPVASLDPGSSAEIMEVLRGIAQADGMAVVCSLHQVSFARDYADRIVGLSHGSVTVDLVASRFDAAAYSRIYGSRASAERSIINA